jgi:hypothetical protein
MMRFHVSIALILVLVGAALAEDKLPPGTKLTKIEAFPAEITLKTPYQYRQLLLTGILDNGDRVDVTRLAKAETAPLVKTSERGQVRPEKDGESKLRFLLNDQAIDVPMKVSGQKDPYDVSFVRDIMPVLSRVGCNAGTCHGSAEGKNGFKLSLRGYDPQFDFRALTDDLWARRINRAAPDASIMLLKTSGAAPHTGGVVLKPGEPYYDMLRSWVAHGAKLDKDAPRVASIEVFPKNPVISLIGMRQQIAVLATYADGSIRDVSAEAFIECSNSEVATVDKQGLVTSVRRGETAIMVRYEGAYTATTLISMGDRTGFEWKETLEFNYIDTLVYEKLKAVKILPSELCNDSDFIRRLYLDLTGLPPEPDAVRAFLNDKRQTRVKRDELIDKLVGGPDYVEHWTNKWADLLQVNAKFLGTEGAGPFRDYIKKSLESNTPYDKFVRSILTASGSNFANPPASYYKVLRDPGTAMENTTHLFLAIRFNCNKCHDHPFERWTQDQYYHLASYFAQVERKEDPTFAGRKLAGTDVEGGKPLVEIISDGNGPDVKHLRTGVAAEPAFPFKHGDLAPTTVSRREQLAHWITSKENPYFARSYVNRVWSYLLGVGIIEPVDDIRAGNPPTNPKLLDALTKEFIDSGFDVQKLVKTICKSRTYQHALGTNKWNADDDINYSHALARRLSAEVLFDSIHRVTAVPSNLPGLPPGSRAAQLLGSPDGPTGAFLDLFGKPPRESACECERSGGIMLGPILNFINGPIVADAIKNPNNRIAKILAANKDDGKAAEELFLAVLNRLPTDKERAKAIESLQGFRDEYEALKAESDKTAAALQEYEKTLPAKQAAFETRYRNTPLWSILDAKDATSTDDVKLAKQPDGAILATDKNPEKATYTLKFATEMTGITGFRLEAMTDGSLPGRGPGRAPNGNFVLNELKITIGPEDDPSQAKAIAIVKAAASFNQDQFNITGAIDGTRKGWAVSPQFGKTHIAQFELKEPLDLPKGSVLTVTLDQQYGGNHTIGRFRIAATSSKTPLSFETLPEPVLKIVTIDADKRSPEQKAELERYVRSQDQELARLQKAAADHGIAPDPRIIGAQDVVWALLNTPAFQFNH